MATSILDNLDDLNDPCVFETSDGDIYREFSCIHPTLERFYFQFEKGYDPIPVLDWMMDRPLLPIIACLVYAIAIFAGQAWMTSRPRWNWRYTLALWNLGLASFSAIGMLRTLPALLYNLGTLNFRDNFCQPPIKTYGAGSTGLWVQLFILSKFPELVDTFFIVIHKKPLIFLHWYHHITVLLYCWHSYVTKSPPGIFFVVMNYSVHASMYFYYFLMAMRWKPKWLHPMMITTFQISQMVVGIAVTLLGFYFYSQKDKPCEIETENNTAAFVMYGSYLALFLQFFMGRYFWGKDTKTSKKKQSSKAKKNKTL